MILLKCRTYIFLEAKAETDPSAKAESNVDPEDELASAPSRSQSLSWCATTTAFSSESLSECFCGDSHFKMRSETTEHMFKSALSVEFLIGGRWTSWKVFPSINSNRVYICRQKQDEIGIHGYWIVKKLIE